MNGKQDALRIVPMGLRDANDYVAHLHRHHKPARGHKFSIAVIDKLGNIRGVAICGRPVSRQIDFSQVLEVSRVATDGCANACSALYGAAARVAKQMGYAKIQTYTLISEPGISLRAAGWQHEAITDGGQWVRSDLKERRTDQPTDKKNRWSKNLNDFVRISNSLTTSIADYPDVVNDLKFWRGEL